MAAVYEGNDADWGGTHTRDGSAASFQFKSQGITHVLTGGANDWVFFKRAAGEQKYLPRYLVNSLHLPQIQAEAFPEGLAGTIGIGFKPGVDVAADRRPEDVSAAETRCREVLKKAGLYNGESHNMGVARAYCESVNFLAAALDEGGLSVPGLHRGARALTSLPPVSTFRLDFSSHAYYGVAAVRDLAYKTECKCFEYLNDKNHPLPPQ